MRKAMLPGATIALVLSSVVAVAPSSAADVEGFDELIKEKGLFKKTLIHPEADFSTYRSLYQETVRIQFRSSTGTESEQETGSLLRRRSTGSAVPDSEDRAKFGQIVSEALAIELGRSAEFQLVEEAGPGTLILRASVLDILSRIPSRSAGETELRGRLIAQGTIVFDLIDAETGVLQARMSERRRILRGDTSGPADLSMVWADIQQWAQRAAADLLQELGKPRS